MPGEENLDVVESLRNSSIKLILTRHEQGAAFIAAAYGRLTGKPSDGRTTSVGSLAIRRFLRPVCYQDLPAALLPAALRDGNPLKLWRRIDGVLGSK